MRTWKKIRIAAAALALCVLVTACGKKTVKLEAPPSGFLYKGDAGTVSLDIKPWPAKTGDATLTVQATHPDGTPIKNADVSVSFTMPAMDMNGPTVKLSPTGSDGLYSGKTSFSMATQWKAVVTVKAPNQEASNATFNFKIAF